MERLALTMRGLQTMFEWAKKYDAKYIGVAVKIKDYEKPQITISPKENFDEKWEFYKKTYTDFLKHKDNENVKIIGFTYGNSFADIEKDLM